MPCWLFEMYWAKCKQLKSHTSLKTLCSYFLLSWGNQVMTKSAHWWSGSCDLHGWQSHIHVPLSTFVHLYYLFDSLVFVSCCFKYLLMSILFCLFWTYICNIQWKWSLYIHILCCFSSCDSSSIWKEVLPFIYAPVHS